MAAQRNALTVLILVEAAAVAYMAETLVYPVLIAVAALAGCGGRWRYVLSADRQVILTLAAALLFAVKWRVSPHMLHDDYMVFLSPFLHALGLFLLTVQTAALFVAVPGDVLPVTLPWPGVFVMLSAGDRSVNDFERAAFQCLALAFVAATAAYFGATAAAHAYSRRRPGPIRRGKALAAAVVLATVAAVGWAAAAGLHRYERALDQIVAEFFTPDFGASRAGFPDRSQLGSIARRKSEQSRQLALRVESPREPGYLRGHAYHWIERGGTGVTLWTDRPPNARFRRGEASSSNRLTRIELSDDRHRYLLADDGGRADGTSTDAERAPGPALAVWPEPPLMGTYFLPPEARAVVTSDPRMTRDARGVTASGDFAPVTYEVETGVPPRHEPFFNMASDADETFSRSALVTVPPELRDDVAALADEVFGGRLGPQEQIDAVEDYFRKNYRYELGIRIPHNEDPIRHFLLAETKPGAHCEYFAQGAALLLRLRGVPTRYMTGFVAAERNVPGGYWIARNEHAHAWCEAWIDGRGWTVVEATPAAGRPSPSPAPAYKQVWEWLVVRITEFRHRFAQGGWPWLLRTALQFLARPAGWLLMLAVAAYVVVRLRMRRRTRPTPLPAEVVALHRLLKRADVRAARFGLVRAPGETLSRFAGRLEDTDAPLAAWYVAYAAARYAGQPSPETVAALTAQLRPLGRRRRRARPTKSGRA